MFLPVFLLFERRVIGYQVYHEHYVHDGQRSSLTTRIHCISNRLRLTLKNTALPAATVKLESTLITAYVFDVVHGWNTFRSVEVVVGILRDSFCQRSNKAASVA